MKTLIIIVTFLIGLPVFVPPIHAQNKESRIEKDRYNYSVAVQPLYLINGGLRIDVEKRLKNPQHVLQLGIVGYLLPERSDQYWNSLFLNNDLYVNKLTGAGVTLDYKWFPFQQADYLYFSGGLSYTNFNLRHEGYYFVSYREDGLTFYEPRWGDIRQSVNKTGANVCFGIQTATRRPFFIDGYVGLGYSYSFYDKSQYFVDDNMFDIGYRGITFITGVRVGYRFW